MKKSLFKSFGVAVAAGLFISSPVQAREFADIYTDCGIGAMISPSNDAVAAVTNVTWDLGTTAISSDASSEENCKGGQVAAAGFIYDAHAQLENDLVKGDGEYLTALLNISGCGAADQAGVKSSMRGEFGQVMNGQGYSQGSDFEKSEAIYNLMNQAAIGRCGV